MSSSKVEVSKLIGFDGTVTKSVRTQICTKNYQRGDQMKIFWKKLMRPNNTIKFVSKIEGKI